MLFVVCVVLRGPKIQLSSKGRPILGVQKGDPMKCRDVVELGFRNVVWVEKTKIDGSEKVPETELSRIDQNRVSGARAPA